MTPDDRTEQHVRNHSGDAWTARRLTGAIIEHVQQLAALRTAFGVAFMWR